MSRARAVEHGRTVLVAATSGVSAIVDPHGRVLQRAAIFTPSVLEADVPITAKQTLASRLGAIPEWGLAALGWVAAAVPLILITRSRRVRHPGARDRRAEDVAVQRETPQHERPQHERPQHERPQHERPQHERPQHERQGMADTVTTGTGGSEA
jgi:hypothetical protein